MDGHYKTLAQNVAKTAAVTIDNELIQKYTEGVKDIYLENTSPEFSNDSEMEEYFKKYEVLFDEDYSKLFKELEEVKLSNGVLSLYIIYIDKDSKTCVYVIDADNTETGCPAGTWDIIYEQNYDVLENPEKGFDSYITNTEEYGWLCSAGEAILDDNGNVIAHAMVDLSMDNVMKERYTFLRNLCIIMLIVALAILILFIFVVDKSIIKPINSLSSAARRFVDNMSSGEDENNESVFNELKINTKDEIENLLHSVQFMEKELHDYINNLSKVTAEKERIGTELNIATQIQADMLPSIFPAFPERSEFDIYATMSPAKEVGGDFYDFFMVDDRHLAIVIADVSGKGVPAALFMVIGKTLIKDHTGPGCDLGEVFTKVNNMLCESNSEGLFITAFEGVLDLVTGEFVFVNAGHECPYVYRKGKAYELYKLRPCFVLAGMENMKYTVGSLKLEEGDKIFQYTDGVTEATSLDEELYGDDRLEAVLNKNKDKAPAELLPLVKEDIDKFVGEAPQFDDITMLCLEYKKKM
ncbi:MAG: SpoIIE family protein phosphatase [Lachnospiraceae bacterium]|nr:SpoIIE family protein phosphatase [Lachnospiraceae bacterium]